MKEINRGNRGIVSTLSRITTLLAMVGLMVIGLSFHPASAETFKGPLIEVLDQIAKSHPKARLSVDPALGNLLLSQEMSLEIGDNWVRDLERGLLSSKVRLYKLKALPVHMITSEVEAEHYRIHTLLKQKKFEDAYKYAEGLKIRNPDDRRLPSEAAFLKSISDENYLEFSQREAAVTRALNGSDERTFVDAFNVYNQSFEGVAPHNWQHFLISASMGMGEHLFPAALTIQDDVETWYKIASRGVTKHRGLTQLNDIARNAQDLKSFTSQIIGSVGEAYKRSESYAKDGKQRFLRNDRAGALKSLERSFGNSRHNFEVRTMLGNLLFERRKAFLALAGKLGPYTRPDGAAVQAALGQLAGQMQRNKDFEGMRYLLHVMKNEPMLKDIPRSSLERLVDGSPESTRVGEIFGLAVRGDDPSQGMSYPISFNFAPRAQFWGYHEVEVNELSKRLDLHLETSIDQSLRWLNEKKADSQLYNYRITIHFKDLVSGKGGDSFGAALGTCSYSSLFDIPVDQRVTMTGSIRAYGEVTAVGGIPGKISAAVRDGRHTAVIPAENRSDLYFLDPMQKQKIRIVTSKRMDNYLMFGLRGVGTDEDAWLRSHGNYQAARIYHAIGLLKEAASFYRKALDETPEDHSSSVALAQFKERGITEQTPGWAISWKGGIGAGSSAEVVVAGGTKGFVPSGHNSLPAAMFNVGQWLIKSNPKAAQGRQLIFLSSVVAPKEDKYTLARLKLEKGSFTPSTVTTIRMKSSVGQIGKATRALLASSSEKQQKLGVVLQDILASMKVEDDSLMLAAHKATTKLGLGEPVETYKKLIYARPSGGAVAGGVLTKLSVPAVNRGQLPRTSDTGFYLQNSQLKRNSRFTMPR